MTGRVTREQAHDRVDEFFDGVKSGTVVESMYFGAVMRVPIQNGNRLKELKSESFRLPRKKRPESVEK